MEAALAKGKILDVVDRLNDPHPNEDPPDFKQQEARQHIPSITAFTAASTPSDEMEELD
jgi:hypothetical protein